jgi:zinc transport system permease protein
MFEIFSYSFMVRAFISGTIIAAIAPLIGTFLVAKRYSLIADTLAHTSLAGVAIGLYIGIYPLYSALAIAIISAFAIEYLRTKRGVSGDSALATFLAGGLALAVTITSLNKDSSAALFSYLFGSLSTVSPTDVWISIGLGILISGIIFTNYHKLLYTTFDEEAAKASGLNTTLLNTMLVVLTAFTVVLAIRTVGALLIGALMTIPVVAAKQTSSSFKQSLLLAMAFSLISMVSGLFIAYFLDLPAGGTVVLIALAIFGISILTKLFSIRF